MLFGVILLFETASKRSAEVLASVPKLRKAEMCPAEAVPVSDKFCSGVSCSATGYELSTQVYSTYDIFKEKHT